MYQDLAHTQLGHIRVDTQAIVAIVSRHLPKGVQCSAVRLRAHDRLCLLVISDRREFWSREDDQRRARSIIEDLRKMGMDLPRLQWIRQTRYLDDHPPFAEHPLYHRPYFWMNIVGGVFAFFALSWVCFVVYCAVMCLTWLAAKWLIAGGWNRIARLLPFVKKYSAD